MTEIANESAKRMDVIDVLTASLLEYKQFEQEQITSFLENVRKLGKIDELNYKRLMLETCEECEWDPIFDHFKRIWEEIANIVKQAELQIISDRIIKGAQMIETERDPVKRRKMLSVYDALLLKLNA